MSMPTSSKPGASEAYYNKKMINAISHIFNEIINENKRHSFSKEVLNNLRKMPFYSKSPSSIAISEYLERILRYTHIEESTLIIALIFIDRTCECNDLILCEANIHRILFASIILAIKYNEDDFYSSSYYSKVGGISLKEFKVLEFEFLTMIRYSLFVSSDLFGKYTLYLTHYRKK